MKTNMVLVTGANGFVGRFLCQKLLSADYSVRALSRKAFDHDPRLDLTIRPALFDSETIDHQLFSGVQTIIHLAARVHVMQDTSHDPLAEFRKVNVNTTLALARQAAEVGVKRFIFVSSVKVNGEHTSAGRPFKEADAPNPQDVYGISKLEAEQGLLKIADETGMEVVIIRPPLIYGPGVKANFASMLNIIRRGIPLPLGAIRNLRSLVYLGNLVDLIITCISHPAAANQVFFVSDDRDVSTTELLCACAHAMSVPSRLVPLPHKFLNAMLGIIGKKNIAQRLCGNLQVNISKAKTLLGWAPPFTLEQGLKQTVTTIKNND